MHMLDVARMFFAIKTKLDKALLKPKLNYEEMQQIKIYYIC